MPVAICHTAWLDVPDLNQSDDRPARLSSVSGTSTGARRSAAGRWPLPRDGSASQGALRRALPRSGSRPVGGTPGGQHYYESGHSRLAVPDDGLFECAVDAGSSEPG